ncbi:MAG: tRNA (adenosine(37)-N6)-threonylcarbamoyltransferase complex ATPase subunit type 1 TsaE [Synergistaceae bacterium]|nr:tRNA (adenosine(37)-N6)-threonylcarbamoyltransferase complex ATPase subunit type 1 TsaE [Synergistaceae bacterium]
MTNNHDEIYGNLGEEDISCKFPMIQSEGRFYTEAIGTALAGGVYGGLLVILSGDLGAGKTAMARAIGRALGAGGMRSPTFAIESVHRLPGRDFKLVHADLYRLESVSAGSETAMQLEEYLSGPGGGALLLVEWGERWEGLRTSDRWDVYIDQPARGGAEPPDRRGVNLTAYGMEAIASMSRAYSDILDSLSILSEEAANDAASGDIS